MHPQGEEKGMPTSLCESGVTNPVLLRKEASNLAFLHKKMHLQGGEKGIPTSLCESGVTNPVLLRKEASNLVFLHKKMHPQGVHFFMAERKGFEPLNRVIGYTISSRAP